MQIIVQLWGNNLGVLFG